MVDGAYLYRETDQGFNGRDANPPTMAVVLDENNVDTGNYTHAWQWVNILLNDLHVRGSPNNSAPATLAGSRFSHNNSCIQTDIVWDHADAAP